MSAFAKFKSIDFYRKIPKDLTEATVSGAGLSIVAAAVMLILFFMELRTFLTIYADTTVVIDQSPNGDLLRINFNISFPALSCEFASVDVNDVLGTARFNLTKTVRKFAIDEELRPVGPEHLHEPVYTPTKHGDGINETVEEVHTKLAQEGHEYVGSLILTADNFDRYLKEFQVVVINFYAPWCPWCQMLEPAWEKASTIMNQKFNPDYDGRIRLAKLDCTQYIQLCQKHRIQGFPSIRVFRKGSDMVEHHGHHEHESYYGERDTDSLVKFAESVVPDAIISSGQAEETREDFAKGIRKRAPHSLGCSINGFVLVKKVPGNLMVSASSKSHSFDPSTMNMTHFVHELSFGRPLSARRQGQFNRLAPHLPEIKERILGHVFVSHHDNVTHDHFLQVVKTEVQPLRMQALPMSFARTVPYGIVAYDYTVHSHTLQTPHVPVAKFHYEVSPMQILITEKRRPFFHFITNLCAIIGGVFTVAGILHGLLYASIKMAKKNNLGKQF